MEEPDLFHYHAGELDKLSLAYIRIIHYGDDAILHNFGRIWHRTIILTRPTRPLEAIGSDIAARLADPNSHGAPVLANSDFIERVVSDAPLNTAERFNMTFYTPFLSMSE